MPRHLRAVLRHSTPRRLGNLLLAESERLLGVTKVHSKPYVIFVDPINLCNLRCPLCATGAGQIARVRKRMDYEHFVRVIDEVAPHAYEVSLYNWGEPLLHTDIFSMIEYGRSKNLATVMSSHLSIPKPQLMDRIVESGLEELTVSIDGTSQEVYERYRVRGDLGLALSNLRRLVARRRELGSKTPYIEWQFIVFKHNEHQVPEARRLADEIGVDLIRLKPTKTPSSRSPASGSPTIRRDATKTPAQRASGTRLLWATGPATTCIAPSP
jgi:MoaA/NifB/PqqE/SkfB family radical SAM enzyme